MQRFHVFGRRRLQVVIAVLAAVVVTVPATVWAGHQFSDVPDSHPFHDEVSAVADAGITTGFPDGTFRPGNNITRQAAAAFFERGVSRVGSDRRGDVSLGNSAGKPKSVEAASIGIDAGAAGSGNGLVWAQGTFTAYVSNSAASACPCDLIFAIAQDGVQVSDPHLVTLGTVGGDSGHVLVNGSVTVVRPLLADRSSELQLTVRLNDADVTQVGVRGQIDVLYVPFGPDGDSTAVYQHACTPSEAEPNDGQASATALPAGECIRGQVGNTSDVDYYSVGVSAGQTLTAETKAWDGAGCSGDSILRLFDFSGTQLAFDDDSGIGFCARASASNLPAGTYFVSVSGHTFGTAHRYRLEAGLSSSVAGDGAAADDVEKGDGAAAGDAALPFGEAAP